MKTSQIILAAAVVLLPLSAFADDGVVKQDQQRIDQDHKDIKADNKDIHMAKDKMAADKKAGDTADMAKDKDALKEARRNKAAEKKRLKQDKKAKHHDEKHP